MLRQPWRDFKIALAFLTRVPVRLDQSIPASLATAAPFFPLIGVLIGALGATGYTLAWHAGLTSFLAATLALGLQALLTGALHEDGLADVADGLGGGRSREEKLEIMRDSRIGTYGVLAIALTLVLRIGALATIALPLDVALAMIGAAAASRALLPGALALSPPARRDGLGAGAGRPHPAHALAAGALAVVVALVLLPPPAALGALTLATVCGGSVVVIARAQIGGLTGDVLGAVAQAAEVGFLLALVALST